MTIELDTLLYDQPKPATWAEVLDFFKNGEFCQEHYLVAAIKKHLRTQEQKQILFDLDFSIEDMLNGRVPGEANGNSVQAIYAEWNAKLGFHHFGF